MGEKTNKGRILIVDDQSGIRESMSDVLLIEGYEVFTFENGFAAIEKSKDVSFDVAFLDIKMPGINGVDTFRGIKRYSPETVVFMITANAEEELINQALEEGAYAIINKPFDMDMIIDIVRDSQKKTAILMVDDEKEFIDKTRQELIKKGYKVISVSDEVKAKESFSRKAEEVVLVNIKGQVNSEDIFKKIKNITGEENPRIIMINSCKFNGNAGEIITVGTRKLQNQNLDINEIKNTIDGILKERKIPEKASVMIIDTDTVLVNTISVELGRSGYDITVVPDYSRAIEQIKNSDFKLVLLNPSLTQGDFKAQIEEIKMIKPDTEVVLLPSNPGEGAKIESYTYLYKPFDSVKILSLIKEICEEKRKNEGTDKP